MHSRMDAMQKLSKVPLLARLDDPFLEFSLAIRQFHKWRTSLTTILLRPEFQIVRLLPPTFLDV